MKAQVEAITYPNAHDVGVVFDEWTKVVYRLSIAEAEDLRRQLGRAIKEQKERRNACA